MARNTQEYINGLVNKQRTYYLDLNNFIKKKDHNCSTCHQKVDYNCYNCNNTGKQLTGEINNLSEFANLKGVNASNNQITNLNFLNTLPNKDKLRGINLFGNQITEIDFAELSTKFPNLEKINLQNNPASAKNLNNLTNQQFSKLVNGIKEQKIRIHSFKGTILMDLLDHARKLASQGQPGYNAHIQTLSQINQTDQSDQDKEVGKNNTLLLVSGLVIFGMAVLAIGYYLGKKSKSRELES